MLRCAKKGFTLIELLVVIAIIAILAAILFPVFASAREKARQTTCASNEKQIGLGMLQYVQDYDEAFPQMAYYDQNGQPVDWEGAVQPYIKSGDSTTVAGTQYFYGGGSMWVCPSFPTPDTAEYGLNYQLAREGAGTYTYSLPGGAAQFRTVALAAIDAPSDKIMIVEKGRPSNVAGQTYDYSQNLFDPAEYIWTTALAPDANGNPTLPDSHGELVYDKDCPITSTDPTCASYGTTPGDMPRFRHTATCNSLFIDGHVKAIHRGQMDWFKNIYIKGVYNTLPGYGDIY